jgi:hypothetical protein
MSSDEYTRRAEILRVAKLAIADFESAGRRHPRKTDLRIAVRDAEADHDPWKAERVRDIMMSVPEFAELLTKESPEAAARRPFETGPESGSVDSGIA